MIVDDEFIVREDLKELIDWQEQGFQIVAEATNGREGVEQYNQYLPQIIITDIKMPIMDGLKMTNEILKKNAKAKFILLTAYDDFDYARQAISLGVKSYVLKHELDKEILTTELKKIRKLMDEELSYDQFVRNKSIIKLLKEQVSLRDMESIIYQYHLPVKEGKTILLVAEFDQPFSCNEKNVNGNLSPLEKEKFYQYAGEIINQDFSGVIGEVAENRYVIMIEMLEFKGAARLHETTEKICCNLQKQVKELFNKTISVSISDPMENILEIPKWYEKTERNLELKVFTSGEARLYSWQRNSIPEQCTEQYNTSLQQFKECIENNEFENAKQVLRSLLIDLMLKIRSIQFLRTCKNSLLQILYENILKKNFSKLSKYTDISILYKEVDKLENIYHIYNWFSSIIDDMNDDEKLCYSKKIREAIQFISKNYSRDITLEEISDIIGVSHIYASQLFKKEVGQSFKTYLNNYRMKRAKDLLESGQYKIYEVSQMVGYQTVQYFCQTFKRITGKSPGEYQS